MPNASVERAAQAAAVLVVANFPLSSPFFLSSHAFLL